MLGRMGRVSQAQAQENRKRIVGTAARLFRERGAAGVSVADVMAEAGLTHGGFYKQFASKEALVAEAVGQAFAEQARALAEAGDRDAFVAAYLSPAHRDSPGDGCPSAALGGDLARAEPGGPALPVGVQRLSQRGPGEQHLLRLAPSPVGLDPPGAHSHRVAGMTLPQQNGTIQSTDLQRERVRDPP